VPPDAQMRFRRLLASFPVEETDETSGEVRGEHTQFVKRGEKRPKKKKGEKDKGSKRGERGGGPARWHLWSSVCDCG